MGGNKKWTWIGCYEYSGTGKCKKKQTTSEGDLRYLR